MQNERLFLTRSSIFFIIFWNFLAFFDHKVIPRMWKNKSYFRYWPRRENDSLKFQDKMWFFFSNEPPFTLKKIIWKNYYHTQNVETFWLFLTLSWISSTESEGNLYGLYPLREPLFHPQMVIIGYSGALVRI